jgi:hypothetical protein
MKVRQTLVSGSPLVQHLVDLFESLYLGDGSLCESEGISNKTIMVNNWKQF